MERKLCHISLLTVLFLLLWAGGRTRAQEPADNLTPQQAGQLAARLAPVMARVERQPDWLLSRLQMYWKSHATEVYVNGETFDHVGGQRAPVPTVKFNGTRGNASAYSIPELDDLVPYDDDSPGNVTFVNKLTGRMEKTSPAKTGCNIATVNRRILGLARDASRLYRYSGDRRYAQLALGVLDTYLKGIYYRQAPTDLSHGHMQTLVGMQTFEVIHEDALTDAAETYRNLGGFVTRDRALYDAALKKWADIIIDHGVPHNNWNLFQAELVVQAALALGPDSCYDDGKGRGHYMRTVTEKSSVRQWSMKRLADFGFDDSTAVWYEAPGYSTTVVGDFADFADRLDRVGQADLFSRIPVLMRAVFVTPQYLFPNRMIVGFGDTHPNYLSDKAAACLARYALRHGREALVRQCDSLRRAIQPTAPDTLVTRYVTPSFYAPNVSWLAMRSGMNAGHDLMVSLNGSLGNHQHANGISMELYGKGYVLGPDAGIGKHLYSGADYQEYYSQFPAHNTVCVDGISAYPVMMSNHAFHVDARYPTSNDMGFAVRQSGKVSQPVAFAQVSFLEPESHARQVRVNGLVKTSDTSGYYIDIFRSKKMESGDKTHDYFYHNLGQKMSLCFVDGRPLPLSSTNELAFAGGHLYAYSYLYNKKKCATARDVVARFVTNDTLTMTMWMEGSENREVFSALSPVNMEYERMPHQPYDIGSQPVLTFVARQHGEAWQHPFVAVFEPSTVNEPSEIARVDFFRPMSADTAAVGIAVTLNSGRTDYIFSSAEGAAMSYRGMRVKGFFAVVSTRFILEDDRLLTLSPSLKDPRQLPPKRGRTAASPRTPNS